MNQACAHPLCRCVLVSIFTLGVVAFSGLARATDPAEATHMVFTEFQAEMSSAFHTDGSETLSLLVDSNRFGAAGFAGGRAAIGGGLPIDGAVWYMAPPVGAAPPGDTAPAIRFHVDNLGIIDPEVIPAGFRLLVGMVGIIDPEVIPIGELDFSAVTGTKGSLNLSGLRVHPVDADGNRTGDDPYSVPYFTLTDTSTPEVAIDIKPGSDPNCFNLNGHGVIPVAILGSAAFDVYAIDLATPAFGGLEVRVRGNRGPLCSAEYVNDDGFIDMVCHFEDDTDNWSPGNAAATLSGKLLDETAFEGSGPICIVP